MVRKSKATCRKCKYHTKLGQGHGDVVCYYVALAGHSRKIDPVYCYEYEKGTRQDLKGRAEGKEKE